MRLFLTMLTLSVVVFGCGKEERSFDTNPALQDIDNDGLGYYEDCDDTNASRNPDAEEICRDGVDNRDAQRGRARFQGGA